MTAPAPLAGKSKGPRPNRGPKLQEKQTVKDNLSAPHSRRRPPDRERSFGRTGVLALWHWLGACPEQPRRVPVRDANEPIAFVPVRYRELSLDDWGRLS